MLEQWCCKVVSGFSWGEGVIPGCWEEEEGGSGGSRGRIGMRGPHLVARPGFYHRRGHKPPGRPLTQTAKPEQLSYGKLGRILQDQSAIYS